MTKEQRLIARGIEFLAKIRETALAMEQEYARLYDGADIDAAALPVTRAWESIYGVIIRHAGQCEDTLARMTLLACGRTPNMLKVDAAIDLDALKAAGACSIQAGGYVVVVAADDRSGMPVMSVVPAANHVADDATKASHCHARRSFLPHVGPSLN